MKRAAAFALLLLAAPVSALGAGAASAGFADPHIQTAAYDPDQVLLLQGVLGYPDNAGVRPRRAAGKRLHRRRPGLAGNAEPQRQPAVLEALARNAVTNMSVATNQRRYAFEMRVMPKGAETASAPTWCASPIRGRRGGRRAAAARTGPRRAQR